MAKSYAIAFRSIIQAFVIFNYSSMELLLSNSKYTSLYHSIFLVLELLSCKRNYSRAYLSF